LEQCDTYGVEIGEFDGATDERRILACAHQISPSSSVSCNV
jgi:hypothetical protein